MSKARPAATASDVLAVVAVNDAVMQQLGAVVLIHVSHRNPDGPDGRVDACPCSRGVDSIPADSADPAELGGGQYLSSGRHTLADVVREALAQEV